MEAQEGTGALPLVLEFRVPLDPALGTPRGADAASLRASGALNRCRQASVFRVGISFPQAEDGPSNAEAEVRIPAAERWLAASVTLSSEGHASRRAD